MKFKIAIIIYTVLLFFNTSCDSFLDVKPKSSIAEEDLFSSEIGFQQALVGVYSAMATRELYGDKLSMGFVSALAQNYVATAHQFILKETTALNFETEEVRGISEGIWSKSYNTIAGLNNILGHIDANKNIFSGNNYAIIKAEALGLRAYLHFELLRLYGPNVVSLPEDRAIPYRTAMNSKPELPEPAMKFIDKVLNDLNEADQLIQSVDPVLNGDRNRRFKMNTLAIRALQARVNLYAGRKEQAGQAALAVINSGALKFVTNAQISTSAAGRDRLFSNEQIFSLRVRTMKDWVETGTSAYFKYTTSLSSANLTRTQANFQTLYETSTGGSTDYRYVYLVENDGSVSYPSKFWQSWSGSVPNARLDQTVPLIRLSEMYYIAAEAAKTPLEGISYLNKVRSNRGLGNLKETGVTAAFLTDEITKEYQKEFYAEGQLFYYYKRQAFVRMLFSSRTLNSRHYILPIPDSEKEFNPQYN